MPTEETKKCPTCHSEIADDSLANSKQGSAKAADTTVTITDPDGNTVDACTSASGAIPQWTDDPIRTHRGFNGADYKGNFRTRAIQLQELQWARIAEEQEAGFDDNFKTKFSSLKLHKNRIKECHLVELRQSTEKLLENAGSTLKDYFLYDKDGNEATPNPKDLTPNGIPKEEWSDVKRGAAYLTNEGKRETKFFIMPGQEKDSPSLPDYTHIRAIHIEDLRHPVPAGWKEFWSVTELKNWLTITDYSGGDFTPVDNFGIFPKLFTTATQPLKSHDIHITDGGMRIKLEGNQTDEDGNPLYEKIWLTAAQAALGGGSHSYEDFGLPRVEDNPASVTIDAAESTNEAAKLLNINAQSLKVSTSCRAVYGPDWFYTQGDFVTASSVVSTKIKTFFVVSDGFNYVIPYGFYGRTINNAFVDPYKIPLDLDYIPKSFKVAKNTRFRGLLSGSFNQITEYGPTHPNSPEWGYGNPHGSSSTQIAMCLKVFGTMPVYLVIASHFDSYSGTSTPTLVTENAATYDWPESNYAPNPVGFGASESSSLEFDIIIDSVMIGLRDYAPSKGHTFPYVSPGQPGATPVFIESIEIYQICSAQAYKDNILDYKVTECKSTSYIDALRIENTIREVN
jgi:hypothetical protein